MHNLSKQLVDGQDGGDALSDLVNGLQLFGSALLDLEQPGVLHGNAYLIADSAQQISFILRKRPFPQACP